MEKMEMEAEGKEGVRWKERKQTEREWERWREMSLMICTRSVYLRVFTLFSVSWSLMVMENKLKIRSDCVIEPCWSQNRRVYRQTVHVAELYLHQNRHYTTTADQFALHNLSTMQQSVHTWLRFLSLSHCFSFSSHNQLNNYSIWVPGSGLFILQCRSWESFPTLVLENPCVFSLL